MSRGTMGDIDQNGNVGGSLASDSVSTESDSVSTQANSQTIYDREERFVFLLKCYILFPFKSIFPHRILLDYSELAEKYKDLSDSAEVLREGDFLQSRVNDLRDTIRKIKNPNMKVSFVSFHSFVGL